MRKLYEVHVTVRPKDHSNPEEHTPYKLEVAASGWDQLVAVVDEWGLKENLEICRHGQLAVMRKARRQEPVRVTRAEPVAGIEE